MDQGIIRVQSVQDIKKFIARNKGQFLVRNSYLNAGLAPLTSLPVLDVSLLNGISHHFDDRHNLILTYQAGCTNARLLSYIQEINTERESGYCVGAGWCLDVGCVGSRTIAGSGPYQKRVGLGLDFIIGGRVILRSGLQLQISESKNKQFLFMLKGAGPSIGVIVQITQRYPIVLDILDIKRRPQVQFSSLQIRTDLAHLFGLFQNMVRQAQPFLKTQVGILISVQKKADRFSLLWNAWQFLYSKGIIKPPSESLSLLLRSLALNYQAKLTTSLIRRSQLHFTHTKQEEKTALLGGYASTQDLLKIVQLIEEDSQIQSYKISFEQMPTELRHQGCLVANKEYLFYSRIKTKDNSRNIKHATQSIKSFAIRSACDINSQELVDFDWTTVYKHNLTKLLSLKQTLLTFTSQ